MKSPVFIANAGVHPELARLAAGLISSGHPVEYFTSLSFPSDSPIPSILTRLPLLGARASALARRRLLPPGIARENLHLVAAGLELAFKVTHSLPVAVHEPVMRARAHRFDALVARRVRPEVPAVICQAGSALSTFTAARKLGVPCILSHPLTHHDWSERYLGEEAARVPEWADSLQWADFPPRLRQRLDAELELADQIFVLSTFAATTFTNCGVPAAKLRVTPLGVDTNAFPRRLRRRPDSVPFRVCFTGQVTQRKGISYLLEAFQAAGLPAGSELLVIGQASPSAVDRLSKVPGVRYHPHISRSELPAIFETVDVAVLPSLMEGFPASPIEAMSSGVPTIVSCHTFGGDVITNGVDGYVVSPRDPTSLAGLLSTLAEDQQLAAAVGRRGSDTAAAFNWQRYVDTAAQAIEALVGSRWH